MENNSCIFCSLEKNRVIKSNELALAFRDNFPVTRMHTLIAPKRHAKDYFELTQVEVVACNNLINQLRLELMEEDSSIEGFNIGMNVGEVAGQTIFHCHIHLIPRRKGDVENPRGGVRHIIPDKGFY
ncbi:Hit Diadenosine tetraphosphate (Ap4A) hydrolase and other HIT family hydrolases [Methylophilaceae bacterium]